MCFVPYCGSLLCGAELNSQLTEMFSYAAQVLLTQKPQQITDEPKRHGRCSVDRRLLLYQRNFGLAWLTKGGERNALDDFCNSVGLVVTWRSQ